MAINYIQLQFTTLKINDMLAEQCSFLGTPAGSSAPRKVEIISGRLMISNCTSYNCSSYELDLTRNYTRGAFVLEFSLNTQPIYAQNTQLRVVGRNSSQCPDLSNPEEIRSTHLYYPRCSPEPALNRTLHVYCNESGLIYDEGPVDQCDWVTSTRQNLLVGCAFGGTYEACIIGEEIRPPVAPVAEQEPQAVTPSIPATPTADLRSFGSALTPVACLLLLAVLLAS